MICWPGSWIGRPGMISCSFPNAMFEPQNEIEPTIAANRIDQLLEDRVDARVPRAPAVLADDEISATAPPPTPLNSATICGIAVIFHAARSGHPIAVPIAMPSAISR